MQLPILSIDGRLPGAALALAVSLTLTLISGAGLAQSCPSGTYEVGRRETAAKIRLQCACMPGSRLIEGRCQDQIPPAALKKATGFVVASAKGKVRAFIDSGGHSYEVSSRLALAANRIETGPDAHLVLQLPSGKRVSIGRNSRLVLGDPLDEYDLNLLELEGYLRFDKPSRADQVRQLARRAFGKTKAWMRRALTRRFRVRTPTACACVRGTDFTMEGVKDGAHRVRVIEGRVDLIPHDRGGKGSVTLGPGEQALLGADGKITRLNTAPAADLLQDWVTRTGLGDLPVYQPR